MIIENAAPLTTIAMINAGGWDANLIVPAARIITVDHIAQTTGGHGVHVDSILNPDAALTMSAGQVIAVDHLAERTVAHNIVLNNTETGRQTGTGNSATGALLAYALAGNSDGVAGGVAAVTIARAGTYRVYIWNRVLFAGGGHVHLYNGTTGAELCGTTANNAALTDENMGDLALTAGQRIVMEIAVACPGSQVVIADFLNADGMWI